MQAGTSCLLSSDRANGPTGCWRAWRTAAPHGISIVVSLRTPDEIPNGSHGGVGGAVPAGRARSRTRAGICLLHGGAIRHGGFGAVAAEAAGCSLDIRLWIADLESGVCGRRATARDGVRLASRVLPGADTLARFAAAAGPHAGPATRGLLPRPRLSVAG